MNPQLQSINIQGSVATMQQNNMTRLEQNPVSSLSGFSTAQQNMMTSLQLSSNMDSGQGNALNSLQQVPVGSNQQTPVSAPQQENMNALSSQSGVNMLQANMNSIQSNSGMLQHQHIKRQQEHQINYVNELKMRRAAGQRAFSHQQLKSGSPFPISSTTQFLQAASPKISQHSSPQNDQQNLLAHTKAGTSSSPYVIPSPSTPMAPSSMPGDSEKPSSLANAGKIGHLQATGVGSQIQSLAIGTPGISASPLLAEYSVPDGTHVKSMSSNALSASVSDIGSVVSMSRIAGSAPGKGSRDAVGEDLITMTKCCRQGGNVLTRDGTNGSRKIRRFARAVPLNVVPSAGNDSFRQLASSETSDLESTATSRIKRPRIEANQALLEEIREIRQRLINTVIDISDEDDDPSAPAADGGKGTIFKCFFDAVAFRSGLEIAVCFSTDDIYISYLPAFNMVQSPIQPLRLLVPSNYPNCSPILLDKFPVEVSEEYEDLSVKAKSKFSISLRSISEPMSLGEIARTWDVCACAVISEHAQQSGGVSFSSRYGTWENCLSAA
ncbi:hypothetical protein GBA52_021676 [Prunus armeniaca]|nr:hypothetical protein GBA52_021676 [Prunus armeniaca]